MARPSVRTALPRFSIIMPTFRRSHVIGRTIETIQAQTFSDWELVIVDNEGADYRFQDPRIRYHVLTERRGASQARNFGLAKVTGEIVGFFDDDDIMLPHYLETFDQAFQDSRVMMAHCGMLTGSGDVNFSYATPEVMVRAPFATPSWEASDCHDQKYFGRIVVSNGWIPGQIVRIPEVLVKATSDERGGLRDRDGRF